MELTETLAPAQLPLFPDAGGAVARRPRTTPATHRRKAWVKRDALRHAYRMPAKTHYGRLWVAKHAAKTHTMPVNRKPNATAQIH
ncbi:hypothetical protein [Nibribacter koreensis]|uniref:Uncharacterized protein n=1 Tax=Nibribacter koreensis TaxID=1084519 RepID=A0ABP8FBM9_9BACT